MFACFLFKKRNIIIEKMEYSLKNRNNYLFTYLLTKTNNNKPSLLLMANNNNYLFINIKKRKKKYFVNIFF